MLPNHRIRIAFVSTNSICQGEQVAQLWPILFDRFGLEIAFAHRTFSWGSEARGAAHVHVVIVGLAHRDHEPDEKRLFSYPDIKGDPVESRHNALTAYLFDARGVANRHLVIKEEGSPINGQEKLITGSKPLEDGYLVLDVSERSDLIEAYPEIEEFIRPYQGAEEFINGFVRWVIATPLMPPSLIKSIPPLMARLEKIREWRGSRSSKTTLQLSSRPTEWHITVIPDSPFLAVPNTSSERREYAPIGWISPPTIPNQKLRIIREGSLELFGVLTSRMHMAWLGHVGGRLESRFSYSSGLVYNTFPWPDASAGQREKIEALAQAVLDARASHPTSSLADLYDPDTMPANLRRAHAALDAAVDRLYRPAPFASDRDRVEHLFGRYEALVNPLERLGAAKNVRVARKAGLA